MRGCALVLCLALVPGSALASHAAPAAKPRAESFAATHESGLGSKLLLWIPNRVLDLFDIVRLRVRVGPGISVSARATEVADVAVGTHLTVFAGLPGPRGGRRVSLPVGLETYAGLEVSVLEAGSEDEGTGPRYGPTEIGAGAQVLLVGLDVGVEPYDALDFLAGILFLDPRGDDF
jgi:hypothetical protein